MDILLTSSQGGTFIRPVSVHGMLWLQTHFEDEYWAALANNQVKLPLDDAEDLIQDASNAGIVLSFLPALTVRGRF